MLNTKRLVRGCLALVLAGCIVIGDGAVFAARSARAAGGRPTVAFNLGPIHVGNPCAQLQASYPGIDCHSPTYVVVKVNGAPLWSFELP